MLLRGGVRALTVATSEVASDPLTAADAAGLRYVSDSSPGIHRSRAGVGFAYRTAERRPVSDAHVLARIRALAIPPAWRHVWICPRADGHIQASGRDARGRKQYRYHAAWREVRDGAKFGRLARFARRLPALRRRVARDLARYGLPRERVLAAVVRLLESTCIRVGNREYARENGSFGLTTMRNRHARVSANAVEFRFRGKAGRLHAAAIDDRRIARIVRRCQELPGQELFQYVTEDGAVCSVGSADVNAYLREVTGEDFTAKDFRTWAGTLLAAVALAGRPTPRGPTHGKRLVTEAVREVARYLGNTPAVCRKCYVHPFVIEAFLRGHTIGRPAGLAAAERALARLLVSAPPPRPDR